MRAVFFLVSFWLLPILAGAQSLTPIQEHRADVLGAQLRCLVCQNENIEESSAPLAAQLRQIIRQQVAQGASNQQVKEYMVQRYGVFILLKPPFSALTALLYASPFLALLIGGGLFYYACRRRVDQPLPLSASEQTRLGELLK